MLDKIKPYYLNVILAEALIILVLCWFIWGTHKSEQSKPLPSSDSMISRVVVTVYAPIKGLDKKEAQEAGIISKDIAKSPDKAVLASGKVEDDSGSRNIAAVIGTNTGETKIVETRPFMETMSRFEIGIGYGLESGDIAKAIQLRATVYRVKDFYLTGQFEGFSVDRADNRHPWNAMAFANYRFDF